MAAHDRERPPLKLLGWMPLGKGALLGKATIAFPDGTEIPDIEVFQQDRQCRAEIPREMWWTRNGHPVLWPRATQQRFSTAVIDLIEAEHGQLGEVAGGGTA
jgi:hypothetical protein